MAVSQTDRMAGLRIGPLNLSALFAGGRLTAVVLFLPPALILFTLFVVLPMGEAAFFSVFNWDGYGAPSRFIDIRNYEKLLGGRAFTTALINNGLIIAVSLLVQLPLALGLAIILAQKLRGAVLFRLIFFLPFVLAEVAAGLIWRFMYDGNYGLIAEVYSWFGAEAPHLLGDRVWAIYAILAVVVWKYFGFHLMIYIAGLQVIPRELYEAAHIDGANRWQVMRYVTIPSLAPTIRLSVFFAVIGALQLFDMVMAMTPQGGPGNSTLTMVSFLYLFGIGRMEIGFGSAAGVVLFIICVVFAFTYKRTAMRND